MTTSVFTSKLDEIPLAIDRVLSSDRSDLARALRQGRGVVTLAIGSGGSAVSAQYLARCRSTLGYAPTIVRTPEEFVLDCLPLDSTDVWIFSAGGRNADARAALQAARVGRANSIRVVTANVSSALGEATLATHRATLHGVDIEGRRDGFLATHSLFSTLVALAIAAHEAAGLPATSGLERSISSAVKKRLSSAVRNEIRDLLADFDPTDCLLLLADPRLQAAAVLIETSLWEAAICPVQRTDFRNFAHGRHVWPFRRAEGTFMLALAGADTRASLSGTVGNLSDIRFATLDYADCGRFDALLAVLDGLSVVESLGLAAGVDPGKPGTGPFAAKIYESDALLVAARSLDPPTLQKRAAHYKLDDPASRSLNWPRLSGAFRERIVGVEIAGIVLDYDGTIIPAGRPFDAPSPHTLNEIVRLLESGVPVAIATGRGGSLGEVLRKALPERWWADILVGYYNGAYLKPLSVDIRDDPPPEVSAISDLETQLRARTELFSELSIKNSKVQLSIRAATIRDVDYFRAEFARSRFGGSTDLKMLDTGRTIDFVHKDVCKTRVLEELRKNASAQDEILCIGDSGDRSGNDHVLLGHAFGVSVGAVCNRPDACWSFFGEHVTGPAALVRVLSALRPTRPGRVRFDLASMFGGD